MPVNFVMRLTVQSDFKVVEQWVDKDMLMGKLKILDYYPSLYIKDRLKNEEDNIVNTEEGIPKLYKLIFVNESYETLSYYSKNSSQIKEKQFTLKPHSHKEMLEAHKGVPWFIKKLDSLSSQIAAYVPEDNLQHYDRSKIITNNRLETTGGTVKERKVCFESIEVDQVYDYASTDILGVGGKCTCPSGNVYYAGSYNDDCTNPACYNGKFEPEEDCMKHGLWSFRKVVCSATDKKEYFYYCMNNTKEWELNIQTDEREIYTK